MTWDESLSCDLEITAADTDILDLTHRRTSAEIPLENVWLADAKIWHARANSPDLAHLAAIQEATRGRLIESADLINLPPRVLSSISRGSSSLTVLELWGLRTLGDFMALPRQALCECLGRMSGAGTTFCTGENADCCGSTDRRSRWRNRMNSMTR